MVNDASSPRPSDLRQWAVRKNGCILKRNTALVIKPVCDPASDRLRRKFAGVHGLVERVLVVVGTAADRAQFSLKPFGSPYLLVDGHSSNSRPSSPTRMPERSTSCRCHERGSRIGL